MREHIIADLSENYVQRPFLERGHTCGRVIPDYGYDLSVVTFDSKGYREGAWLYLQLKATDDIEKYGINDMFSFTIDVASYNQYIKELVPVYFVLFDAQGRQAYWVNARTYCRGLAKTKKLTDIQQSVQIYIPRKNVMNFTAIDEMQKEKNAMVKRGQEAMNNDA